MGIRRRIDESSLELLLDTITNTFGGILFLAILVSLLLRTTSTKQSNPAMPVEQPMAAADQAAYEVRLEDLRDQVTRLQAKRSTATRAPKATPSVVEVEAEKLESDLAKALGALAEASLRTAEHQRARAASAVEISRLDERRDAAATKLNKAAAEHEQALAEARELERQRVLLDKRKARSAIEQTAGMPVVHDTDKRQVAIYVRFGKVFMMHVWRDGERQGPNPEFFIVIPGNPPVARPKPDSGIRIDPESIDSSVRDLLRMFPPARWVVAIVVFGDSFEEFQLLKRAVVEQGYEYMPIPVKPGGSVFDSGGESTAQ